MIKFFNHLIKLFDQFKKLHLSLPPMPKKKLEIPDPSTEEKIKAAARKVFTKNGFAATRTRDIAEEAGINLALLNYYFRSKEKLFDLVMLENVQQFLSAIKPVLFNEQSSLREKIEVLVENYINMLKQHPHLPLFILSEMKASPEKLAANMGVKHIIIESVFFKQIMEATNGKFNPIHLLVNTLSLSVFPFAASPLLKAVTDLNQEDFNQLMEERKRLIPIWVMGMLCPP